MTTEQPLESTSLIEQFVLLGLVELSQLDQTPAQTHRLRKCCRSWSDRTSDAIVGAPSEADVMRTLYRLESKELVAEADSETTSPVGKGRPAYDLAVEPERVLEWVWDSPLEEICEELRDPDD